MIKKILLAIIFSVISLMVFTNAGFAQEVFKVTSVNFDTSNAVVFLTSPDNTVEPILKNIKLVTLSKPSRAYFDIDSAIMTAPAQNWYFNSGGLKQIKIGQFSTNPNKIRVVMYFEEGFDPKKVSFLKVNNNIAIKFKEGLCNEDYFQNAYSEETTSSSEFYENLTISNEEAQKVQIAVNTKKEDEVLKQIQQAFNDSTAPEASLKPAAAKVQEGIKKELKLKSKYYIEGVHPKPNAVLISGFGVISVEKPMYLTSPARVVFDLPNTVVDPEIRNKEFKINEKESFKIGQFDRNKARIVITSDELEKFIPIFSSDSQSLLIAHVDKIDLDSVVSKTTDAVSYFVKPLNPQSSEFIIAFNAPVVHAVHRDSSKLTVYLYNAMRYNDEMFRNALKSTGLSDMKMELLPKVGLKLTLPLEKTSTISTYAGSDGRAIKIIVKGMRKQVVLIPQKHVPCGKNVVLDAGHGGSDYGAIRAGINEKDINLDIAKRVEALLCAKGARVEMTRRKDEAVSLQDRTMFCASKSPDIFVSIHVNSSVRPEIVGIETHYYHSDSLDLAQTVHSCLASRIKSKDRGLFKSKFYVINHTDVPAILVEIGFISNDRERGELVSEQRKQQTADAIADGIWKYINKR